MIIGDLNEGDFIRDPRKHKLIMIVKKKNPSSSVLVWGYDPIAKVEKNNIFRSLAWDQVIEKVSI